MRVISNWAGAAVLLAGLGAAPVRAQVVHFMDVPTPEEMLETLNGQEPSGQGFRTGQTMRVIRERPDLPDAPAAPAAVTGAPAPRQAAARRPPRPASLPALAFSDNFRLGSAELPPKTVALLENLAEALRRDEAMVVLISGHTDSTGTAAVNARLSLLRAENARRFLVERGSVAATRVAVLGAGSSQPMPGLASGAAENRRIQVVRVAS